MSNYRYAYLRTPPDHIGHRGFPIACIAMDYDALTNTAYVGLSVVHPKDMKKAFSKRLARSIASGRAENSPVVVPIVASQAKPTSHSIMRSVMTSLGRDANLPLRVRKAIRAWLAEYKVAEVIEVANHIKSIADNPEALITASAHYVKSGKRAPMINYTTDMAPSIPSFLTPPIKMAGF